MMRNARYAALCPFIYFLFVLSPEAFAEITILESPRYVFNTSGYLRTDMIMLKNNIDLDSKNKDDSSTYAGLDYGVAFDLKLKDNGPEFYLKFERNGPFDYDAPIFIHNTLMTSSGPVERYRGEELFPHVEEFYYDVPLPFFSLRFKNGLYTYEVGNGLALTGYTENYGLTLYNKSENIQWRFYYCYPDIANGIRLGPFVEQEKEQGIMYDHSKANFFAGDVTFITERYTIQPYVGVLIDRTGDRRDNYFLAPTHKDMLGTVGIDTNVTLEKLSLGMELARNFGKAESEDPLYDDVKHTGYLVYADAEYDLDKFTPHSRFILASGNKVTTDMVDNGDEFLDSDRNRAFSSYSPMNVNLSDSIYPNPKNIPMLAMGNGYGLNYGINRPGTFLDPFLPDNIIFGNLGFDYQCTDKLSFTLDWWHLRAKERGIGTFEGFAKELSTDLGNEVDVFVSYEFSKNFSVEFGAGYFFPGKFYREERDDDGGSLLTPFVRGDGKADNAYQIELSFIVSF